MDKRHVCTVGCSMKRRHASFDCQVASTAPAWYIVWILTERNGPDTSHKDYKSGITLFNHPHFLVMDTQHAHSLDLSSFRCFLPPALCFSHLVSLILVFFLWMSLNKACVFWKCTFCFIIVSEKDSGDTANAEGINWWQVLIYLCTIFFYFNYLILKQDYFL